MQFPSSIHLCCTMLHTQDGVADRFIKDVRESAETIMPAEMDDEPWTDEDKRSA